MATSIAPESIVNVLKQGPASISVLARHFSAQFEGSSAQLKQHLGRRLRSIPGCVCALNKVWVYLPQYLTGAHVLQPVVEGSVQWLPEVMVFFNPTQTGKGSITVRAASQKEFRVRWHESFWRGPSVSQEWASWMHHYVADFGYDAFDIRCVDGLRRIFDMHGTHLDEVDRNEADNILRRTATSFIARHHGPIRIEDIAQDVMTSSVYHSNTAPHSLIQVLFDPEPIIRAAWSGFFLMPPMPAQVMALLQSQDCDWAIAQEEYQWYSGGLPISTPSCKPDPPIIAGNYVIKAEMAEHAVTRVIKIAAEATFSDLHYALIDAVDFDDDH
ncbi:MAG: hypothetical protein C7B45_11210 [Sulfobacillus acidophilus]|uniref:Uncharacterized protein n=1 Tax=Sulfobacillus acidophilus TaxID=53633 RepID=A0A2T2WGH5_9FIRM|nr:MAG: hypothetical protein C7B45_11210 [Sulfobacillus acidophilus]